MKIAMIGSGTASRELPGHLLRQMSDQKMELTLITPRLSLFALTPYERLVVDVGYVDACQQAEAEGVAAVMINSFADYGIEAARAVLNVPVYGAGESALQAARAHGTPFGIVTVWPRSMGFLYTERLRALACEPHCCGIRHLQGEEELQLVGSEEGVMARMAREERDIIDELLRHCDEMITLGARSIVLGCTCMSPIAAALAEHCSVPVIDGSVAALRAALQRRGSPLTTAPRSRRPDLIPALVSGSPHRLPPETTSDCPVCLVTENPS